MPTLGLTLKDDLLPHITGGFRSRAITVGSLEVSSTLFGMSKNNYINILQYSPWMQFIRDKQGKVVKYSGLIFTLLDEISYKLNFTYVVKVPEDGL